MATMNNTESKNDIMIVGTAVSKYFPQNRNDIMILTVATRGSSSRTNYPRIAFYGAENVESINNAIEVDRYKHPHVLIQASLETTRRIRDGQNAYYQTIVGKNISIAPTKLDSALNCPGNISIDDVNRASIMGEVVHVFQMGTPQTEENKSPGYILSVKTVNERGRFSFPKLVCFSRNAQGIENVAVGDTVAAVGVIQTRPRNKVKPGETYESIVCSDIVKL